MTFEDIYKEVDKLQGWMPKPDCRELYDYVSQVENGLIVEIGSFMGRSTLTMALSSPTSKIISIDPYLKVHHSIKETPKNVKRKCIKAMKGQNWKLRHAKSEVVGRTWNKLIDFLVIDGDHHVQVLEKDIELFVPHVKKGGWVFFHDYNIADFVEDNGGMVKSVVDKVKDTYFDELISNPTVHGWAICRKF